MHSNSHLGVSLMAMAHVAAATPHLTYACDTHYPWQQAKDEVAEIWITFPDPQLRTSKAKKRLTHPKFLRLYQQLLVPGGLIHLKTDSPDLYDFTKQVIDMYGCVLYKDDDNIYDKDIMPDELKIKTHYESLDIAGSNQVHYLCFSLPVQLPGKEKDEELKSLLKNAGAD